MSRIEHGIEFINRFIKNKNENRPWILVQTRTSYEIYHLIQYINLHKLKFDIIITDDELMKYTVTDETPTNFLSKVIKGKMYGPDLCTRRYFYKKPIKYIKVYSKA